jgi:hypothetical protein
MRLLPFRRRRSMNVQHFTECWKELQKHCANRRTWPQAITDADNLLDEALKRAGYKGKSTGERLVAAQHDLTANNMIWLGHKLRNRLTQEDVDVRTLKKKDMVDAMAGFRQALRDLGALPS